MRSVKETHRVFSEIDNLYNFVSYGSQRMDEFMEQVHGLESSCTDLTSKSNVNKFMQQCNSVDNVIRTTGDSIKDWKTKAGNYLVFVHEVGQDVSLKNEMPRSVLGEVEEKIHLLIAMLRQQNNHILYLRDKLKSLYKMVMEKRSILQRKVRRGREPMLHG